MGFGGDGHRPEQVAREADEVRDGRGGAVAGRPSAAVEAGVGHRERLEYRIVKIAAELNARLVLHGFGQHAEAVVGVDPALPRLGDQFGGVHRQPRRVGQQVANCRAGRAGRAVEVHHAFFDRYLRRASRQWLGDRRQRESMPLISELGQHAVGPDDGSRGRRDRPACDGLQRRHGFKTYAGAICSSRTRLIAPLVGWPA